MTRKGQSDKLPIIRLSQVYSKLESTLDETTLSESATHSSRRWDMLYIHYRSNKIYLFCSATLTLSLTVEFPGQLFPYYDRIVGFPNSRHQLNSFMYENQPSRAFMFHKWTEYDIMIA